MSIIVRYGTYINTRAELSLEAGRVVSHWGRVVSRQLGPGRVVLGRVVGGPSCLPTVTISISLVNSVSYNGSLNVFAVTQCGNDSRCLNGGTCVNEEFCVCPDNFVGSRCEHGNYLSVL